MRGSVTVTKREKHLGRQSLVLQRYSLMTLTGHKTLSPSESPMYSVRTGMVKFDRLTGQFDIRIARATHPVKSAASPPGRNVNRRYPVPRQPLIWEIPYNW
ncbi:hypothetical protein E2C01_084657 [Portunus trituberculatus]|uniref:Uncharacterized protein n=1 Tax=Portunus trituberculatus TaxID=210409 RepID=A0A5B7IYV7_PORTR|nr:hypothetical protein [Portunus trituberculatus]